MPVVGKYKELWYLVLFVVLTLICLAFVILWESSPVAVFRTMGAVIIITTATSITVVEAGTMLAEKFLERRYREGREAERKAWLAWLERRIQAEKEGRPFDEPPPAPTETAR
jgi:ABC-type microcin C transport system permease subunit YejE